MLPITTNIPRCPGELERRLLEGREAADLAPGLHPGCLALGPVSGARAKQGRHAHRHWLTFGVTPSHIPH